MSGNPHPGASGSRSRRLAAVWFADIADFTALSSTNEDLAVALVQRLQTSSRQAVDRFGGNIVKFMGDSTMAEFASTDAAVRAALALQTAFSEGPETESFGPLLRIGLHVGEIVRLPDGDVYGEGVNIAARLEREAPPGQVVVSEDVWRQLRQRPDYTFADLGERLLKGVPDAIRIFSVALADRPTAPARHPVRQMRRRPAGGSVAVLPFVNSSSDPENEYFSDGITEELLNALVKIDTLRVPARTSSFAFKGKNADVREIGRKLDVAHVLEGSVRRAGKQVRITAQLIDASNGFHLWSETYDRVLEDMFSVQDEISRAIVGALQVRLGEGDRTHLVKPPTEDFDAYDLYLKGRHHWNRRTEDGLQRAIECFEGVVARDPSYALAYAGIAEAYIILSNHGYVSPKDGFPAAKDAVLKALALDTSLAEAHAALGVIEFFYDWKWADAEREIRRAIELSPRSVIAHIWYSLFLVAMGRSPEAIAEADRALELDPLSLVTNTNAGMRLYHAHRYDEAAEQLEKTIEMKPDYHLSRVWLALTRVQQQDYQAAIREARTAVELSGGVMFNVMFAIAHAGAGHREEALATIGILSERSKRMRAFFLASVFAALGENDQAFDWLEIAHEERSDWLTHLDVEPSLSALHADPRFEQMRRKVGLPAAATA